MFFNISVYPDPVKIDEMVNKVSSLALAGQSLQEAVNSGNFTVTYDTELHYVEGQEVAGHVVCQEGMVYVNFYCGQSIYIVLQCPL